MIDVDLMLEEAEKQKAMHFVMAAGFTNSEIIFMLTRLREAEKDAARYRWLRDVGQHIYYVDDILACTLRGAYGCIDEYMKERGDE